MSKVGRKNDNSLNVSQLSVFYGGYFSYSFSIKRDAMRGYRFSWNDMSIDLLFFLFQEHVSIEIIRNGRLIYSNPISQGKIELVGFARSMKILSLEFFRTEQVNGSIIHVSIILIKILAFDWKNLQYWIESISARYTQCLKWFNSLWFCIIGYCGLRLWLNTIKYWSHRTQCIRFYRINQNLCGRIDLACDLTASSI